MKAKRRMSSLDWLRAASGAEKTVTLHTNSGGTQEAENGQDMGSREQRKDGEGYVGPVLITFTMSSAKMPLCKARC